MTSPMQALAAAVAAVGEAWGAALPFGCVDDGDASVLVDRFSDAGLFAVVTAVGALSKRVDGLAAVLAGEVARRSPAGRDGFARRHGHASATRLVAESRGGQVGRASALVKVGEGTASRRTLTGEVLPAVHPDVAAALHAGRISVDAAHLVIAMLDRVAPRATPADVAAVEELLAGQAAVFPLHQLEKLVRHAEARLDPDGVAPREEDQRAARSLTMRQDPAGMFHLRGTLDPESGAPIKTALDAYVTARLRETRGNNHPGAPDLPGTTDSPAGAVVLAGPDGVETRSIPQLQADALGDFARHVLACDTTVPLVPAVTMVVRMDLDDLGARDAGGGYATVDGIDHPISGGAARRLACDAGLIPAVFAGASVPLDLGRRSRTFTRAQVLALWERDGGCAFCGQTTFVEAHHIRWWHRDHGTTDLSNGVLLCSRCHHLIHRDGWGITVSEAGEVSFTPPRHLDPGQVPRAAAANPRTVFRSRHGEEPDRPPGGPKPPSGGRAVPLGRAPAPASERPPGRSGPTRPPTFTRDWRIHHHRWCDLSNPDILRALLE